MAKFTEQSVSFELSCSEKAHEVYKRAQEKAEELQKEFYSNMDSEPFEETERKTAESMKAVYGLYKEAAEAGCISAMEKLSNCYRYGFVIPMMMYEPCLEVNLEKARDWALKATSFFFGCNAGNESGASVNDIGLTLSNLGDIYAKESSFQDEVESVACYGQSAFNYGCPLGLGGYGKSLWNGAGIAQDHEKARKWIRLESEMMTHSTRDVLFYKKNYDMDIVATPDDPAGKADARAAASLRSSAFKAECLKNAAASGNARAQGLLAEAYMFGFLSKTENNMENAIMWYEQMPKALLESNGGLCYLIGFAYSSGDKKNQDKVLEWYEKGSALHHASAARELGIRYYFGLGDTSVDKVIAARHFEIGVAAQDTVSMAMLGKMLLEGDGVVSDPKRGLSLQEEAAKDSSSEKYRVWVYNDLALDLDIKNATFH